jgi:predicted small integral membrane protein
MAEADLLVVVVRVLQVGAVALIGFFAGSVAWNNCIDPQSNLAFVRHLMSMDTTFETSRLRARAVTSEALHKLFFGLIVLTEAVASLLCLAGACWLAWHFFAGEAAFHNAKWLAFAGLGLGFALWFGGFMIIGGQWFASWQSKQWNGRESAFMFYSAIGVVMILLLQKV